jgi:hypothetical protein
MILDLSDEQARALLNLLIEVIEADRYPRSPRIRLLQEILGKCGEVGGLSPELAARLRRYAPPPPAQWPTPEERDPSRRPRPPAVRGRPLLRLVLVVLPALLWVMIWWIWGMIGL